MTNDQNPDNLAPLQPSLDTTAPAVPAGVFDDLFDHAAVFDVSASPVLIVHARQAYWVQGDTAEAIDPSTIRGRLTTEIPLVLHAPSLAKRLTFCGPSRRPFGTICFCPARQFCFSNL